MNVKLQQVSFYDALEANDIAVKAFGEPALKDIGRESMTIDWKLREAAQAQLRLLVRRILVVVLLGFFIRRSRRPVSDRRITCVYTSVANCY